MQALKRTVYDFTPKKGWPVLCQSTEQSTEIIHKFVTILFYPG